MLHATAPIEMRRLLTSDWPAVERKYGQLADKDERRLRAREKTKLLDDICAGEFDRVESPSLRLSKFVHIGDNTKRSEIDAVVRCTRANERSLSDLTDLFCQTKALPGQRCVVLRLAGRLIVNQAGGVLENAGLCIHPHAGIAYIPGSAVKGATRHAAWIQWMDAQDRADAGASKRTALNTALVFGYPSGDRALDEFCAKQWRELFGEGGPFETFAGMVAFMPAMPVEHAALVTDIVNCHHADYYRQGGTARDNENPNPQFFPAVEKGTAFQFIIRHIRRSYRRGHDSGLPSVETLMGFAQKCLRLAAEEHGFGAKTAAGYGWFVGDKDIENTVNARRVRADEERRNREAEAEMSDEERRRRDFVSLSQSDFAALLNTLGEEEETIQRVMLDVLFSERMEEWKVLRTAKKGKKAARLAGIAQVATKLGVELP